jgi:hypothetical protein
MEIDIESPNNTIHNLRCVGRNFFYGTYIIFIFLPEKEKNKNKNNQTKDGVLYTTFTVEYGWH